MSIHKNLSLFDSPIIQDIYTYLQNQSKKLDVKEIMKGIKRPRTTCNNNLNQLLKYNYINSERVPSGSQGRPRTVYWTHQKNKFEEYEDDDYLSCDQCEFHEFIRISSTIIKCKSCNCRFAFNLQEQSFN